MDGDHSLDGNALADSLAGAMDKAMADVYKTMKGVDLPAAGLEDRRMLFVAIAEGMLTYLKENEDQFISSIRYEGAGAATDVVETTLGVEL